ncbi:LysR family transcriptional regulator [Marinobacteraceae bacterium S3BR75-40.1]
MDLQAVEAFVAIVDHESFSHAAESLHLTQPAISKRLATLEKQLGHPLIERGARQLRLTDAGHRLLPHARRILDDVHNAKQDIAHLNEDIGGALTLIISHHIGLHHLPRWLQRFRTQYPSVQLQMRFMESEMAFEHLEKREAELAFATLNDRIVEQFQVHHAWEDPMKFVVAPEHPLASQKSLSLAVLSQHEAILPAATTETYRVVSHLFLTEGINLQAQMPTNYLETIKVMCAAGLGWSVLPENMLDDSLIVLDLPHRLVRLLGAVGLARRQPFNAAKAFLEVVRDIETGL